MRPVRKFGMCSVFVVFTSITKQITSDLYATFEIWCSHLEFYISRELLKYQNLPKLCTSLAANKTGYFTIVNGEQHEFSEYWISCFGLLHSICKFLHQFKHWKLTKRIYTELPRMESNLLAVSLFHQEQYILIIH